MFYMNRGKYIDNYPEKDFQGHLLAARSAKKKEEAEAEWERRPEEEQRGRGNRSEAMGELISWPY